MSQFRELARDYRLTAAADPELKPQVPTDHDDAEAAAMAEHYAAPPGPDPPSPDLFTMGLLQGFHEHRARLVGR